MNSSLGSNMGGSLGTSIETSGDDKLLTNREGAT
jgi:hypothetical protein